MVWWLRLGEDCPLFISATERLGTLASQYALLMSLIVWQSILRIIGLESRHFTFAVALHSFAVFLFFHRL